MREFFKKYFTFPNFGADIDTIKTLKEAYDKLHKKHINTLETDVLLLEMIGRVDKAVYTALQECVDLGTCVRLGDILKDINTTAKTVIQKRKKSNG